MELFIALTATLSVFAVLSGVWGLVDAVRTRMAVTSQPTRNRNGRWVYAFHDWGSVPLIKIGRATDVHSRLAAHRTAAPLGIWVVLVWKVPDAVHAETYLHDLYKHTRRGSSEWFWMTPGMIVNLMLHRGAEHRAYVAHRQQYGRV